MYNDGNVETISASHFSILSTPYFLFNSLTSKQSFIKTRSWKSSFVQNVYSDFCFKKCN